MGDFHIAWVKTEEKNFRWYHALARVEVHNYSRESNNVAHVLAYYGLMHEVRNILFVSCGSFLVRILLLENDYNVIVTRVM